LLEAALALHAGRRLGCGRLTGLQSGAPPEPGRGELVAALFVDQYQSGGQLKAP